MLNSYIQEWTGWAVSGAVVRFQDAGSFSCVRVRGSALSAEYPLFMPRKDPSKFANFGIPSEPTKYKAPGYTFLDWRVASMC